MFGLLFGQIVWQAIFKGTQYLGNLVQGKQESPFIST
jgi:hypothetical protein